MCVHADGCENTNCLQYVRVPKHDSFDLLLNSFFEHGHRERECVCVCVCMCVCVRAYVLAKSGFPMHACGCIYIYACVYVCGHRCAYCSG